MDSVLVLIAAPDSRAIDGAIVAAVRDITGTAPEWLSENEAVEVFIPSSWRKPGPIHPHDANPQRDEMAALREIVKERPVDLAVLPAENRRKRLLIADMDSTMIGQECIDELGALAGIGERIAAITARAMAGELDFEGALRERVALMAGLAETAIAEVLKKRITFSSGGATLVKTMKAHGAYTALVSGGFVQFTSHVARHLGFNEHRANEFIIEGGILSGRVREPILGKDAKLDALHAITGRLDITPQDAIAVGDGANDIPMLKASGLGVALHAKPKVQGEAPVAINHGDLTALLYLQGYRRDEFVTS